MNENEIKCEIKEIDILSPVSNLDVGMDYFFSGKYIKGYEEGVSKIKRFYKEVIYWNGVYTKPKKAGRDKEFVWVELENGKIDLIGYITYNNELKTLDNE